MSIAIPALAMLISINNIANIVKNTTTNFHHISYSQQILWTWHNALDELTIGQHKKCKKKLNWNMDQYTSNFAIPEHDIGIIS